jgi:hypothetical protein
MEGAWDALLHVCLLANCGVKRIGIQCPVIRRGKRPTHNVLLIAPNRPVLAEIPSCRGAASVTASGTRP